MGISNDLVPRYARKDLDDVATEFLAEFCPEALVNPMPVPIRDIAKNQLGLRILERHITEDLSVLGMTCFQNGIAEIYDRENEEYREIKVRSGTIIVDPDTLRQRNIGCMNNTIAHETFHWWKHRDYHILQKTLDKRVAKRYTCPAHELEASEDGNWTDEMWMEWQANNVAPRILMPVQAFMNKTEEYLAEARQHAKATNSILNLTPVIERLADFFVVSKQSVEIRLTETGYL